jgi:valyl-tRNA synthetase
MNALIREVTSLHEEYAFAQALQRTEKFFWKAFCDTYLELLKPR